MPRANVGGGLQSTSGTNPTEKGRSMFHRSPRPPTRAQKLHALFQFGWLVSACVAFGVVMFVSHSWLVQVAALVAFCVAAVATPAI